MTADATAPAGPAQVSLNPDYTRTAISTRSMVISTAGIVAAENPRAGQAGTVVLTRGGHPVGAAIAVNAVMGLVPPMMNDLGGDLLAIVHDSATDTEHGLNARLVARDSGALSLVRPHVH